MRRILSVSWVGQGDFGDEAMSYALRYALAARDLPPPDYYQQGAHPRFALSGETRFRQLHSAGTPDQWRRLKDRILLRSFDTVMIGGGSLFHSERSIRWKHEIVRRVRARFGARAVLAAIGVSVGPFASSGAAKAFEHFARDMDLFVTRDDDSARLVSETETTARIIRAVDASFLLPGIRRLCFPQANKSITGLIGLSVVCHRDDSATKKEELFQYFLNVMNGVLRAGQDVRLFTLYVGSAYLDATVNDRLKRECMAPDRVDVHAFSGDVMLTARAIAECDALCAQRLHAMLFSYLAGVPYVSLGYHQKNALACKTLNYPSQYVFEQTTKPPAEAIVQVLVEMAERGIDPFIKARTVAESAETVIAGCDVFAKLWQERAGTCSGDG